MTAILKNNDAPALLAAEERQASWESCKRKLRGKIPSPFFESFINPIQVVGDGALDSEREEEAPFRLYIPDERLKRHVQARYFSLIQKTLRETSFQGQVSLISSGAGFSSRTAEKASRVREERPLPRPATNLPAFFPPPQEKARIEKFLDLSFSGSTGLLIGPSGSGKTALARRMVAQRERARFLNLEVFLTEFSLACRARNTIEWRSKLRAHDLIVIDDFQFIKESARKTQEEIRLMVDDFQEKGRTIILCMDADPGSLPLQADLASRFLSAERLELRGPDPVAAAEILRAELRSFDLELSEKSIIYLAGRLTGDARKIQSAVLRLRYYEGTPRRSESETDNETSFLDELLGDLYSPVRTLDPERILRIVAESFRLRPEGVTGPARDRKHSMARHLTAYLCSELLDIRLVDIARAIGRKDHAGVIHARDKIKRLLGEDLFLRSQVEELITRIRADD